MKSVKLSPGRLFEEEVFGVTERVELPFRRPARRSKNSSIQLIIKNNWAEYAESLEKGSEYCHNPARPRMAKTGLLWEAVKNYLPQNIEGDRVPLNLYIAIGRTTLDWQYGVDAFFWWGGVYVTFDASMMEKVRKLSFEDLKPKTLASWGEKKKVRKLSSDFVLTPKDLTPKTLASWGKKVAELLKERLAERNGNEKLVENQLEGIG
jgi:hypothetical protein